MTAKDAMLITVFVLLGLLFMFGTAIGAVASMIAFGVL